MGLFDALFGTKQERQAKAFADGYRYAREQLLLYGDDPAQLERLEAEALGWEDGHPFDRGMQEALLS